MHVNLHHFLRPNISHIMFSSRHKGKSSLQSAETLLYDIMLIMLCEKQPSNFFGPSSVLSTLTSELLVLLKRRCASVAHLGWKQNAFQLFQLHRHSLVRKFLRLRDCPTYWTHSRWEFVVLAWHTKTISATLQQHWTKKCQQTWNIRCSNAHIVVLSPLWRNSCEDSYPARIFCYCRTQPALCLPYHLSFQLFPLH